jgi:AcrR family transcriptional regulator
MERRASSHVSEHLVRAAVACIRRDGIEGVTTRAIAREAGMNIAAVNYYFASKDALVAIALEHVFAPPAAPTKKDARTALFTALDDMLARFACLAPQALRTTARVDLRDAKRRRAFLESLLEGTLGPARPRRKSSQRRENRQGQPRRPLSRGRRRGKD